MKIDLGRLIKKKNISSILNGLLDSPLLIEDVDANVLLGEAGHYPEKEPVTLNGEIIGWVYGNKEVSAAASLLTYMANSENDKKALGQETLEKYREVNLLYDITEKLAANLNPKEVAGLIIHEAKRLIKADSISLMLLNEETGYLEVIDGIGRRADPKVNLKVGEGIAGNIVKTGKPEILNDVSADPRYVIGISPVSSLMCAPLKIKDKVIGVINISSKMPANYTAEDLKLLSSLTLQAAAAIENARLYDSLKETFVTAVYTLAETIEKRDPYTGGHTKRVMEYSEIIGRELGLTDQELEKLRLAAILHDIGKIGVRDNILLKNSPLDDIEFNEIKKHTIYGSEVLKYIKYFKDIIPGVKCHHERYDGKGYPEGLAGEDIDIIARIIAVGDTYDAITSDRPYRKGLSKETAYEEIRKNAGTQFDPEVAEAFLRVVAEEKKEDIEDG